MSTLVIAAHPDDEVLGCGGTIARLAASDEPVHIVILGEGITSRHDNRQSADQGSIEHLHEDSRKAAEILGAASVRNLQLPDNRFDTVALLDVVKLIEGLVEELQPTIVYTQHGGDLNIDHQVTFRATLTATRPMVDCPVQAVYAYPVASSTEWAFGQFAPRFEAQVYSDIRQTMDRKIAAMQAYASESRDFPHPRSPEALRAAARYWGTHVGLDAAEVFSVVREIRT